MTTLADLSPADLPPTAAGDDSAAAAAPTAPSVSIIIVNWRSQAFVRACLESIARTVGDRAHEILIVDNASFDGCAEMVRSLYPSVRFFQSADNLGFAGANNLAFRASRGRHILFLNPDTELLPGALDHLVAALESRAEVGMVGAHLLNTDGTLQTTCIAALPTIANQTLNCDLLRGLFPRWRMWGMRALYPPATKPVAVEAISGACMLGRREVFAAVGAFSECYFMYAEDMDLSRKVSHLGRTILYVPAAKIVHHAGSSSAQRKENHFSDIVLRQSVMTYFRRYHGRTYTALYRVSLCVIAAMRLILLLLASPVLLLRSRRRSLGISLRKWKHILGWAMHAGRAPTAAPRLPEVRQTRQAQQHV